MKHVDSLPFGLFLPTGLALNVYLVISSFREEWDKPRLTMQASVSLKLVISHKSSRFKKEYWLTTYFDIFLNSEYILWETAWTLLFCLLAKENISFQQKKHKVRVFVATRCDGCFLMMQGRSNWTGSFNQGFDLWGWAAGTAVWDRCGKTYLKCWKQLQLTVQVTDIGYKSLFFKWNSPSPNNSQILYTSPPTQIHTLSFSLISK